MSRVLHRASLRAVPLSSPSDERLSVSDVESADGGSALRGSAPRPLFTHLEPLPSKKFLQRLLYDLATKTFVTYWGNQTEKLVVDGINTIMRLLIQRIRSGPGGVSTDMVNLIKLATAFTGTCLHNVPPFALRDDNGLVGFCSSYEAKHVTLFCQGSFCVFRDDTIRGPLRLGDWDQLSAEAEARWKSPASARPPLLQIKDRSSLWCFTAKILGEDYALHDDSFLGNTHNDFRNVSGGMPWLLSALISSITFDPIEATTKTMGDLNTLIQSHTTRGVLVFNGDMLLFDRPVDEATAREGLWCEIRYNTRPLAQRLYSLYNSFYILADAEFCLCNHIAFCFLHADKHDDKTEINPEFTCFMKEKRNDFKKILLDISFPGGDVQAFLAFDPWTPWSKWTLTMCRIVHVASFDQFKKLWDVLDGADLPSDYGAMLNCALSFFEYEGFDVSLPSVHEDWIDIRSHARDFYLDKLVFETEAFKRAVLAAEEKAAVLAAETEAAAAASAAQRAAAKLAAENEAAAAYRAAALAAERAAAELTAEEESAAASRAAVLAPSPCWDRDAPMPTTVVGMRQYIADAAKALKAARAAVKAATESGATKRLRQPLQKHAQETQQAHDAAKAAMKRMEQQEREMAVKGAQVEKQRRAMLKCEEEKAERARLDALSARLAKVDIENALKMYAASVDSMQEAAASAAAAEQAAARAAAAAEIRRASVAAQERQLNAFVLQAEESRRQAEAATAAEQAEESRRQAEAASAAAKPRLPIRKYKPPIQPIAQQAPSLLPPAQPVKEAPSVISSEDDTSCVVCMDAEPDVISMCCQRVFLCSGCATAAFKTCPQCNVDEPRFYPADLGL